MKAALLSTRRLCFALLLHGLAASSAIATPGRFELGMAAGLAGYSMNGQMGLGSGVGFEFGAGLSVGAPWTALAPAAELRAVASAPLWREEVRLELSILFGLAEVPKARLAAPFGGGAFGIVLPLFDPAFALRTELIARIGGREYEVSSTGPSGTVRCLDSWSPGALDLQIGLLWKTP